MKKSTAKKFVGFTGIKRFARKNDGAISWITLAITIFLALLLVVIFDLCRIFVVREITKNASDAASLAVAQNLIFFESCDCEKIANEVAQRNGCNVVKIEYDYDEVVVVVEKELSFVVINKFTSSYNKVQSSSKAKVIYPWDSRFGYCKSYRFSY